MDYNDPSPAVVSRLAPSYRHQRFGRTHEDLISTETHLGFFRKDKIPTDIKKLQDSKIIELPIAPRKCSRCGDYMVLARNKSVYEHPRYTCIGKCLDTKAVRFIKKMKMKDFQKDRPRTKHVEGVQLHSFLH